ncbi:sensor histidine kinase [Catenulispora subtropica]|uniref:histidine kinase n=1 Tax=Catenulispora subtropica TaxID=450798 RepID=A0ABP5CUF3_9ACTN
MGTLTETLRDRRYVWGIQGMRLGGLFALGVTIAGVHPQPGLHGRGLALSVTLMVAALAWIGLVVFDVRKLPLVAPLAVMAVSGGLLGALQPGGPAIAVAAVASFAAGSNLAPPASTAVTVLGMFALTVGGLVLGAPATAVIGFVVILGTALGMGMIRYGVAQRADQAELLLEQTRRASAAETEAAVLGERTRIAREIHDILAHSLGALAMQVEAAQALLTQQEPDVAKAVRCVERAGQLTREGLAESRRAVHALRDDLGPLPSMIGSLVEADGGAMATVGGPRRLPADAALALYRTAQEAVTNARKHAPGQAVAVELRYDTDVVRLSASNSLPDAGADRPLTATGGGFGLDGLRERIELVGGTLTAGPDGDRWVVRAVVPG